MYRAEETTPLKVASHPVLVKTTMRRKSIKQVKKETKEALAEALQGLEGVCMTRRDDPKLSALRDDIRRTIERPEPEKE